MNRLEARLANAEDMIGTALQSLVYLSTRSQELEKRLADTERLASRIEALEKQAANVESGRQG